MRATSAILVRRRAKLMPLAGAGGAGARSLTAERLIVGGFLTAETGAGSTAGAEGSAFAEAGWLGAADSVFTGSLLRASWEKGRRTRPGSEGLAAGGSVLAGTGLGIAAVAPTGAGDTLVEEFSADGDVLGVTAGAAVPAGAEEGGVRNVGGVSPGGSEVRTMGALTLKKMSGQRMAIRTGKRVQRAGAANPEPVPHSTARTFPTESKKPDALNVHRKWRRRAGRKWASPRSRRQPDQGRDPRECEIGP